MKEETTPAMKQYYEAKKKYPDCIIFFRMGDFYEMFFDDAKIASRELGIALTSRGQIKEEKIPLAGIPIHAAERYISQLIKKGYKIAICEQLEDPKLAKKVVKRDVIRIITPGTLIESTLLDANSNNYILSLYDGKENYGMAYCDLSTGEFSSLTVNNIQEVKNEIARINPSEIVLNLNLINNEIISFLTSNKIFYTDFEDRYFYFPNAYKTLLDHFKVINLEAFGLENKYSEISAAGALLQYLKNTQKVSLAYINKVRRKQQYEFMQLDQSTIKNLEILKNIRENSEKNSLYDTINYTLTSIGARALKKALLHPMLDIKKIKKRLAAVEELVRMNLVREELIKELAKINDIERIISRISYGSATPRDILALKTSLEVIPRLRKILENCRSEELSQIKEFTDLTDITKLIHAAIREDAGTLLTEGDVIKKGYNNELDQLKEIKSNVKEYLAKLETSEREATGIKTLKVRYNKVFGYYIEVSNSFLDKVPSHYIRKQTLANAERFITEELKEKEEQILNAEEKIIMLEKEIFSDVVNQIKERQLEIQDIAQKIATLDIILSCARCAIIENYSKPEVNEDFDIVIREGRHPVIEKAVEVFIPNDVNLNKQTRIMIITGPNMAGKSTYMRQVALITLMAQCGMFVPAKYAKIGIVDKIFTRIGARDDLTAGQSTFMIEMTETANILHNATEKSLILLDEIGRGTSTFDGIAIAWATAEYIATKIGAKTLFSTHYHILNELEKHFQVIKNFNISVKETEDEIIFLRKIVEGGTDKSYGIHVAKIAGMPKEVVERSKEIQLKLNEEDELSEKIVIEKKREEFKNELKIHYVKNIQTNLSDFNDNQA